MVANNVAPIDLWRMARSIASTYGDKGAVVITVSDEGVRVGTEGLTSDELRYALCVAINYSFMFTEDSDIAKIPIPKRVVRTPKKTGAVKRSAAKRAVKAVRAKRELERKTKELDKAVKMAPPKRIVRAPKKLRRVLAEIRDNARILGEEEDGVRAAILVLCDEGMVMVPFDETGGDV